MASRSHHPRDVSPITRKFRNHVFEPISESLQIYISSEDLGLRVVRRCLIVLSKNTLLYNLFASHYILDSLLGLESKHTPRTPTPILTMKLTIASLFLSIVATCAAPVTEVVENEHPNTSVKDSLAICSTYQDCSCQEVDGVPTCHCDVCLPPSLGGLCGPRSVPSLTC